MTAYEVYKHYLALKQHFTKPGYSFHKYNGKVNVSVKSFEGRRDRYYFEKLAKKRDTAGFLLANMVEDPKIWVGQLVSDDESETRYKQWQKRNQSLSYTFKEELQRLSYSYAEFDALFTLEPGRHPALLQSFICRQISIETLIILVHMTGCFNRWNKRLEYDPVWREVSLKIVKYQPFMNYELEKYRSIVLDIFGDEE